MVQACDIVTMLPGTVCLFVVNSIHFECVCVSGALWELLCIVYSIACGVNKQLSMHVSNHEHLEMKKNSRAAEMGDLCRCLLQA